MLGGPSAQGKLSRRSTSVAEKTVGPSSTSVASASTARVDVLKDSYTGSDVGHDQVDVLYDQRPVNTN